MKFSVCIDIMWPQEEFLEGMETVRATGLSAYEFWNWQGKDLDAIFRRQQELGLTPAAFCTKEWNLVDPEQRGTFLEGLKESLAAAGRLGCKTLISQVGSAMPGVSRERQTESIIQGLKAAAPLLEDVGVRLAFEPLNAINHGGYFLERSGDALEIAEAVDSPWVTILFDFYHQQITEGDLIRRSLSMLGRIGHVHCAGNPGRHELDIGEIRYDAVFRALRDNGYSGFLGLEYSPTRDRLTELRKLAQMEADFAK